MLPAGQDAAQQNGRVDRGDFGIPDSFAGVDVGPVIEESAMVGQRFPQKAQRGQHPVARLGKRNEAALLSDAQRREAKTCGGDAGHERFVGRAWRALQRSLTRPVSGLACSQK